jgi:methylase of polypeptide subunit release factors
VFLCEVGSGSGVISANVNNWLTKLDRPPLLHISIDINMDASVLSSKYYSFYNLNIQQINTSLFNNFAFEHSALSIKPDVIIFNPPYVPVEQE